MGPAPRIIIVFKSVRLGIRSIAVPHAVKGSLTAFFSGAAIACTRKEEDLRDPMVLHTDRRSPHAARDVRVCVLDLDVKPSLLEPRKRAPIDVILSIIYENSANWIAR